MEYEEALQERLVRADDIPISLELGRDTAISINKDVDLSAVSIFVIRPTKSSSALVGLNKDFLQVIHIPLPTGERDNEPVAFQESIDALRKERSTGSPLQLAKNIIYAVIIGGCLAVLLTVGIVIQSLIIR